MLGCERSLANSPEKSMQESLIAKNDVAMKEIYNRMVQTVKIEIKDLQTGISSLYKQIKKRMRIRNCI
jgi:hypothetical protein